MKTKSYGLLALLVSSLGAGCSNTLSDNAESGKASDYYTQLGVGYLQKGRIDLASMNLEKAIKDSPSSSAAHHYYALLQQRLGNKDLAGQHFQKALKLNNKDSELLNNYGSFLCHNAQYDQAEAAFLAALRDPLYKTPEFAYTNAGVCIGKKGDKARAEEYFRQALQANANFPDALYHMAKLNYEKGNNAKAQAFLYRYNDAAPANPDGLLLCYQIQTAMNETTAAKNCAANLQAQYPDSQAASQLN